MTGMGRLSQTQLQLFFLINTFFLRPQGDGLAGLIDSEVADAAQAVAATFETASRGVIFEHQARTPGGQRLATELLGWLREAGKGGGSRFERDVAEVVGGIQRAATPPAGTAAGPRDYLERVARVLGETAPASAQSGSLVIP